MSNIVQNNIDNFVSGLSSIFFSKSLSDIKWILLSPELIKFTENNIFFRQIVLFVTIFISTEVISDNLNISLEDKIIGAFFLYLFILIFSKQLLHFNLFELILFFIIYFLFYSLTNYNLQGNERDEVYIALYVFTGLLIITTIIGNYYYYLKQLKDRGKDFSFYKFFFSYPKK